MGRSVYCNGEFVWKYVFASQNSEQYRIYEELGIGEYERDRKVLAEENGYDPDEVKEGIEEGWIDPGGYMPIEGDFLTLTRSDIPKLERILSARQYPSLKKEYSDFFKEYRGANVYFKDGVKESESTFQKYTLDEMEAMPDYSGYGMSIESPLDIVTKKFSKEKDFYFYQMIQAFIVFMQKHEDLDVFEFQGEF